MLSIQDLPSKVDIFTSRPTDLITTLVISFTVKSTSEHRFRSMLKFCNSRSKEKRKQVSGEKRHTKKVMVSSGPEESKKSFGGPSWTSRVTALAFSKILCREITPFHLSLRFHQVCQLQSCIITSIIMIVLKLL
jgi:hypothetical protein